MGALSLTGVCTQGLVHNAASFQLKCAISPAGTATSTPLFRNGPPGRLSVSSLRHGHRPAFIPCRAQVSSNVTFHFDSTSITMPLAQDAAVKLSEAIESILNTFREKEKATRPRRWESMDFRHTGDGVVVEFFCNPNAYTNFFQAKALITVNDDKLKIVTEAQLSAIKAEVEQYIKAKV